MTKKTVSIITLGCKTNQYESESLMNTLSEHNITTVLGLSVADYYIINTCAVTNESEKKSRGMIAKILKLNPKAKIYVCGCASLNDKHQFTKHKNVVSVIGTANKTQLAELIINDSSPQLDEELCPSDFYEEYFVNNPSKTRSIIKIQDGCNNFCSYCIIPYLRGRERSRPLDSIEEEIKTHSKQVNEIVFTGINASSWGSDLPQRQSLKDLVDICGKYPSVRFRFSSLEAGIISEEFLVSIKKAKNICLHFHLSLQSGNNNVLKSMNRKYTIEEFAAKVILIRKHFPLAGITTDIIVGFPTETEADFSDGLKNIRNIGFSDIHIFPYSRREGTLAAKLTPLNGTVVAERKKTLNILKKELSNNFIEKNLGKEDVVLVEKFADKTNEGFSSNYIKCYIKTNTDYTNQLVRVRLREKYKDGVLCTIVQT